MENVYPALLGKHYVLVPIEDSHYETLQEIVLAHPKIYQYTTLGCTPASFARWFVQAQQHSAWVVVRSSDKKVVGSTRLYEFDSAVGSVKIGYTWYHPDCRGTGINDEVKYLVLQYIFETLNINRVVFEINTQNKASRRAVEKLGADLEGVFREVRLGSDGALADGCVYALFSSSWQQLKQKLQNKIGVL